MGNHIDALRGVSNKDHRSAIEDLISDGWAASKTGSGHIKLSHPDASRPVITSSTPSCFHAPQALKGDAKRALRGAAMQVSDGLMSSAMSASVGREIEEKILGGKEILRSDTSKPKRKGRWSKAKKERRNRAAELSHSVPDQEADKENKEEVMSAANTVQPVDFAKNETNRSAENANHVAPTQDAGQASIEAPVSSAPSGLIEIPQDILAIAMRIASGDIQTVEITQDMVGKTLGIDGHLYMIGGSLPQTAKPNAPIQPERPKLPAHEVGSSPKDLRDLVKDVLLQFRGEHLKPRQIAELIDCPPSRTLKSHESYVRTTLNTLVRDETVKVNRVKKGSRVMSVSFYIP